MSTSILCPVCGPVHDGHATTFETGRDSDGIDCKVCGRFEISGSAGPGIVNPKVANLSAVQRAYFSHRLRQQAQEEHAPLITTDWLKRVLDDARLPSPSMQANNLIRLIGDQVSETGKPYFPHQSIPAIVGAPNPSALYRLIDQLVERGLILKVGSEQRPSDTGGVVQKGVYDLTLDGWERYESERRGQIAGGYGFIALKFGDGLLDRFVKEVVKPTVRKGIGYDLVDMRDVAQAGVIDNIMRAQIRDAAFVIVDLTHDNSGAYWEAGYAEGLGKPVIYICERTKFEDAKTYFDTNHCTTVLWSQDDADGFGRELVATLRRSLNLFPSIP